MSTSVSFKRVGGPPRAVSVEVKAAFDKSSLEGGIFAKTLILEELKRRATQLVQVGKLYGNPLSLLEKVESALAVVSLPEGGFRVGFDLQELGRLGVPERLLLDLEYGTVSGLPPTGFWRVCVSKLKELLPGALHRILS